MAGFNNSAGAAGLNGRSTTNDYGRAGFSSNLPVNAVEILPNMNKTSVMKAAERLPQFVNESPQSVEVLISSQNRISGSRYNFTADIGSTIFRPRLVTVDSVVLPKLYNITAKNNHIAMRAGPSSNNPTYDVFDNSGTPSPLLEFDIPPGYYTPEDFRNAFHSLFRDTYKLQVITNNGWVNWNFSNIGSTFYLLSMTSGEVELFVEFDNIHNTFSITQPDYLTLPIVFEYSDSPGGAPFLPGEMRLRFWIDESCSFIQRGSNFVPFDYPSPSPNGITTNYSIPANTTYNGIPSGTSGMLYTRFCTLSSNALHRYSFAESRVSRIGDGGGRGKIITVIDTSYYQIVDGFGGSFLPAEYPNASVINVNNAQGQLEQYLDFVVRDEYGDPLDNIMTNPLDRFGITFWLHVFF